MATQYRCKNERRLQLLRAHPTLNAIDYLEVLDDDAPAGTEPQTTLLVHFLQPLIALNATNVRITGGVRIRDVRVLWAGVADTLATPPATAAELALLAALPDADRVLVVRTNSYGDFSTYRLDIVKSASDDDPPTDFDPQLSSIDFSFKVDCPDDFDCKDEDACPPESFDDPQISYLAKDYASFRQLMLDRMSVIMPEWRERNAADEGIAVIEALAYAADQLSYYQDAVATEAYLDTARRRISLRRHARLLDYELHDGCNARVWVQLDTDVADTVVDQGTMLLTRTLLPEGVLSIDDLPNARAQGAVVFETMHGITLQPSRKVIKFHTWSNDECCLPVGATAATLVNEANALQSLAAGDVLVFEERLGPATGKEPDADQAHRHAVRLTGVDLDTDPLDGTKVAEIRWGAEDALPFPLCISTRPGDAADVETVQDVSIARGNIVLADHGESQVEEGLKPKLVPETGTYRPVLRESNLTYAEPYRHQEALKDSASATLRQDPRRALPQVKLTDSTGPWTPQRDLLGSDAFAPEFVVEMESDGVAHLRFGDASRGRLPTPEEEMKATYRAGNGPEGNVGAGTIVNIITAAAVTGVSNPMPAASGSLPEDLNEVRFYAPQAFRVQERAVTAQDYATVAQRHVDVQKAEATLRWTGSWHTMFVAIDRKGGRKVDEGFREEVAAFFERYRLAGYDVGIEEPNDVPLDVAFTVCVKPGYLRSDVRQALLQKLGRINLPDGGKGFFHPDNFTFGQPVYLSQVVAAIMEVPGVDWVDTDNTPPKPNRFQRWGKLPHGELEQGRIPIDRLEIARLDNDPSVPENGRIEFFMEGGL